MGERKSDDRTTVERHGDVELVITRLFDAEPRIVWDAWTKAELFQIWWAPKSSPVPMIGCEMDVRVGGGYSVTFGPVPTPEGGETTMTFYGQYLEVDPGRRLVWTNDEGGDAGQVTTVTFAEAPGGQTRLVMTERYPTKEAFEASAVGMEDAYPEQFGQLDELLASGQVR